MTAGGRVAGRVLVGYDGGTNGADALAFARRWAQASGDEIVVVTVHPGAAPVGPQRVDAEWAAYERDEAEKLLDRARDELGDAEASFRQVYAGSAARGLHEVLEEQPGSTALVVLAGAGRPRRTARRPAAPPSRLLHGASAPVSLVPGGYAGQPGAGLSRILLGYVDTSEGRVALDAAVRLAGRFAATLAVVTVVPDTRVTPAMGEPHVFADAQHADFATANEAAVERARRAGVQTTGQVAEGVVHEVLAGLGPDRGDLLVLGSRGYGPVLSVLLGGVSGRVVRSARLPVVMIPRGDR